jgi:hypothetical protein
VPTSSRPMSREYPATSAATMAANRRPTRAGCLRLHGQAAPAAPSMPRCCPTTPLFIDGSYQKAVGRYELVDPAKRHVARELEARWNGALERVAELEGRIT